MFSCFYMWKRLLSVGALNYFLNHVGLPPLTKPQIPVYNVEVCSGGTKGNCLGAHNPQPFQITWILQYVGLPQICYPNIWYTFLHLCHEHKIPYKEYQENFVVLVGNWERTSPLPLLFIFSLCVLYKQYTGRPVKIYIKELEGKKWN